jgi:hypothetical protein
VDIASLNACEITIAMNKTDKNMQERFYFYSFSIVFVYNSRARERLIFTASPKHQMPFNSWCATADRLNCIV